MDSELEQAFQACVLLLQTLPQQVKQVKSNSTHALTDLQEATTRQEQQLLTQIDVLEGNLRDVRNSQHQERSKGVRLMEELEQVKTEKASEASVLQEQSPNISQETSIHLNQLKQEVEYLAGKLSLYCNTTRIRWDYTSTTSLSGQILTSSHSKPFSQPLSPPDYRPTFDQVNALWSLMD